MTAILYGLLSTAYLVVANLCIRASLEELSAKGCTALWRRTAATVAGFVWPVTLTVIVVWALRARGQGGPGNMTERGHPADRTGVANLKRPPSGAGLADRT